jgi:hypothetical protein
VSAFWGVRRRLGEKIRSERPRGSADAKRKEANLTFMRYIYNISMK